jgi:hypothetical protein
MCPDTVSYLHPVYTLTSQPEDVVAWLDVNVAVTVMIFYPGIGAVVVTEDNSSFVIALQVLRVTCLWILQDSSGRPW